MVWHSWSGGEVSSENLLQHCVAAADRQRERERYIQFIYRWGGAVSVQINIDIVWPYRMWSGIVEMITEHSLKYGSVLLLDYSYLCGSTLLSIACIELIKDGVTNSFITHEHFKCTFAGIADDVWQSKRQWSRHAFDHSAEQSGWRA